MSKVPSDAMLRVLRAGASLSGGSRYGEDVPFRQTNGLSDAKDARTRHYPLNESAGWRMRPKDLDALGRWPLSSSVNARMRGGLASSICRRILRPRARNQGIKHAGPSDLCPILGPMLGAKCLCCAIPLKSAYVPLKRVSGAALPSCRQSIIAAGGRAALSRNAGTGRTPGTQDETFGLRLGAVRIALMPVRPPVPLVRPGRVEERRAAAQERSLALPPKR
jgi:hypothetical protein